MLADIPAAHEAIDAVYTVRAGKFRRYHGEGWRQLFDIETQAKNVRDAIWVLVGVWQSYWLIRKLSPTVIFTRGGYVSVPVALGGRLNGVPYITHDSDSMPSLANRVIARWASLHVVALPAELYPYPRAKTVTVGIPVSGAFQPATSKIQHEYQQELGFGQYRHMLLVTGGGNGADELNRMVAMAVPQLLHRFPDLVVVHVAGRALEAGVREMYEHLLEPADQHRVVVKSFVTDLHRYSAAADVIVARGGATALAEFAVQGKACIVVPAKQLVWQEHHARTLAEHGALIALSEDDSKANGSLGNAVAELLLDGRKRQELARNLAKLAQPDAAHRLAMLLLEQSK